MTIGYGFNILIRFNSKAAKISEGNEIGLFSIATKAMPAVVLAEMTLSQGPYPVTRSINKRKSSKNLKR